MKYINVGIDEELHQQIKVRAAEKGVAMSVLVEEALKEKLHPLITVKANRPIDKLKAEVATKALNASLYGTPEKKPQKDPRLEKPVQVYEYPTMEAFDVSPPLKDSFNPQPKKGGKKKNV